MMQNNEPVELAWWNTARRSFLVLAVTAIFFLNGVNGQARMLFPLGRASQWRNNLNAPQNFEDHLVNCGGKELSKSNVDKLCGVCGDNLTRLTSGHREILRQNATPNEAGGMYALGTIHGKYNVSQEIVTKIQILASRKGYIEFHLCPNNDFTTSATTECMNAHPLKPLNGTVEGYKWIVPEVGTEATGFHYIRLQLPVGLECKQCVFRMRWRTGTNWGAEGSVGGLGLGAQEYFFACSDIQIGEGFTHKELRRMMTSGPRTTVEPWPYEMNITSLANGGHFYKVTYPSRYKTTQIPRSTGVDSVVRTTSKIAGPSTSKLMSQIPSKGASSIPSKMIPTGNGMPSKISSPAPNTNGVTPSSDPKGQSETTGMGHSPDVNKSGMYAEKDKTMTNSGNEVHSPLGATGKVSPMPHEKKRDMLKSTLSPPSIIVSSTSPDMAATQSPVSQITPLKARLGKGLVENNGNTGQGSNSTTYGNMRYTGTTPVYNEGRTEFPAEETEPPYTMTTAEMSVWVTSGTGMKYMRRKVRYDQLDPGSWYAKEKPGIPRGHGNESQVQWYQKPFDGNTPSAGTADTTKGLETTSTVETSTATREGKNSSPKPNNKGSSGKNVTDYYPGDNEKADMYANKNKTMYYKVDQGLISVNETGPNAKKSDSNTDREFNVLETGELDSTTTEAIPHVQPSRPHNTTEATAPISPVSSENAFGSATRTTLTEIIGGPSSAMSYTTEAIPHVQPSRSHTASTGTTYVTPSVPLPGAFDSVAGTTKARPHVQPSRPHTAGGSFENTSGSTTYIQPSRPYTTLPGGNTELSKTASYSVGTDLTITQYEGNTGKKETTTESGTTEPRPHVQPSRPHTATVNGATGSPNTPLGAIDSNSRQPQYDGNTDKRPANEQAGTSNTESRFPNTPTPFPPSSSILSVTETETTTTTAATTTVTQATRPPTTQTAAMESTSRGTAEATVATQATITPTQAPTARTTQEGKRTTQATPSTTQTTLTTQETTPTTTQGTLTTTQAPPSTPRTTTTPETTPTTTQETTMTTQASLSTTQTTTTTPETVPTTQETTATIHLTTRVTTTTKPTTQKSTQSSTTSSRRTPSTQPVTTTQATTTTKVATAAIRATTETTQTTTPIATQAITSMAAQATTTEQTSTPKIATRTREVSRSDGAVDATSKTSVRRQSTGLSISPGQFNGKVDPLQYPSIPDITPIEAYRSCDSSILYKAVPGSRRWCITNCIKGFCPQFLCNQQCLVLVDTYYMWARETRHKNI